MHLLGVTAIYRGPVFQQTATQRKRRPTHFSCVISFPQNNIDYMAYLNFVTCSNYQFSCFQNEKCKIKRDKKIRGSISGGQLSTFREVLIVINKTPNPIKLAQTPGRRR